MSNITAEQIASIGRTMKECGVTHEQLLAQFPERPKTTLEGLQIVAWIKRQVIPSQPSAPQDYSAVAPLEQDGKAKPWRYALRDAEGAVKFYRVKRGRKPGMFFVDVQASDDLHSIRNPVTKKAILEGIAKDPRAALALYGQEIGSCGRCGRALTSEYRKLGIGPVCIDK